MTPTQKEPPRRSTYEAQRALEIEKIKQESLLGLSWLLFAVILWSLLLSGIHIAVTISISLPFAILSSFLHIKFSQTDSADTLIIIYVMSLLTLMVAVLGPIIIPLVLLRNLIQWRSLTIK